MEVFNTSLFIQNMKLTLFILFTFFLCLAIGDGNLLRNKVRKLKLKKNTLLERGRRLFVPDPSITSCVDATEPGCLFPGSGFVSFSANAGSIFQDCFGATLCDQYTVGGTLYGCMDPNAENYNADATEQAMALDSIVCTYATIDDAPIGCLFSNNFSPNIHDPDCSNWNGQYSATAAPAPAPAYTILIHAPSDATTVYITGPGWGYRERPTATNNNDGTWSVVLDPPPSDVMEYVIVVDGGFEDLLTIIQTDAVAEQECEDPITQGTIYTDYATSASRKLPVGTTQEVTFNSCTNTVDSGGDDPAPAPAPLELKGIMDFETPVGSARGIHLVATADISDLSEYGISIDGEDTLKYTLSGGVDAGDNILVIRYYNEIFPDGSPEYSTDALAIDEYQTRMSTYLGECYSEFQKILTFSIRRMNGDDAIKLLYHENVIETYGEFNVDGTSTWWEYMDSWAYKDDNGDWTHGAVGCTQGGLTTAASGCEYPMCLPCSDVDGDDLCDEAPGPLSWTINAIGYMQVDGDQFTHPTGAEPWGGFVFGIIDRISYADDTPMTFTAAVVNGGTAEIRFRFEKNVYPDTEPSYDTSAITITGATETTYTVTIPSQGANTFGNVLLFVDTLDEPVIIKDVVFSPPPPGDLCTDTAAANWDARTHTNAACAGPVCEGNTQLNGYVCEAIPTCGPGKGVPPTWNEAIVALLRDGSAGGLFTADDCVICESDFFGESPQEHLYNGLDDYSPCGVHNPCPVNTKFVYSSQNAHPDGSTSSDVCVPCGTNEVSGGGFEVACSCADKHTANEQGVCQPNEGCTNSAADNYDPNAHTDDGSCVVSGCTNSAANNYDSTANTDDGSCVIEGCMDETALNYNADATTACTICETCTYAYKPCVNGYLDTDEDTSNDPTSTDSSAPSTDYCHSCENGYWLNGNVCEAHATCPAGQGVVGSYDSSSDSQVSCEVCDGVTKFNGGDDHTSCNTETIGCADTAYYLSISATASACLECPDNSATSNAMETVCTCNAPSYLGDAHSDTGCTGKEGCTDSDATNYDAEAITNSGCTYANTCSNGDAAPIGDASVKPTGDVCASCPLDNFALSGALCLADSDNDGVANDDEVNGCTDSAATNHNSDATEDDSSCTYAYSCSGGTESAELASSAPTEDKCTACDNQHYLSDEKCHEYDTCDSGLGVKLQNGVLFPEGADIQCESCMGTAADGSTPLYNAVDDQSPCGNHDACGANKYFTFSQDEQGSCTDCPANSENPADNFLASCTCSSGFENYDQSTGCTEIPASVAGCTSSFAHNYNAAANEDDGSCQCDVKHSEMQCGTLLNLYQGNAECCDQ